MNSLQILPSFTNVAVTTALSILLLSEVHGNPLVFPNKFSHQKTTTTTSTTPLPTYGLSNASFTELGISSSGHGFRYDIAAGICGAILVICAIFYLLFYPRRSRQRSNTCSVFQAKIENVDRDSSRFMPSDES